MMVTNSKQLIEMKSELFLRCKSVLNYFHWKGEMPLKFQSDCIATTYKQGAISNDQYCWGFGIKYSIGISNLIPESGNNTIEKKINSSCIIEFTKIKVTMFADHFWCFLHGKVHVALVIWLLARKFFVEITSQSSMKPREPFSSNSVLFFKA